MHFLKVAGFEQNLKIGKIKTEDKVVVFSSEEFYLKILKSTFTEKILEYKAAL